MRRALGAFVIGFAVCYVLAVASTAALLAMPKEQAGARSTVVASLLWPSALASAWQNNP